MDLLGVTRAVNDGVEIYGIWLGTTFVWPDPWRDTWEEGIPVYWENVWRNQWSLPSTSPIVGG
jgi:hypothetical protein